jgi:tRNA-Thr(GGU) m(6)t(6)A37 methyltransferase TsaA
MITLEPIGTIRTPYPDKHGVPRQPGLVPAAVGRIHVRPEWVGGTSGLQGCSHVWLLWWFDRSPPGRAKVRPPRLGGNTRIGVFATRSPVRPNPIGISVCPLLGIEEDGAVLVVGGVDLVDHTPILDIKPYLPYVDAIPDAVVPWVPGAPVSVPVELSDAAGAVMDTRPDLRELVLQVMAQDPRPATHKAAHRVDGLDADRAYTTPLYDVQVRWRFVEGRVVVEAVEQA